MTELSTSPAATRRQTRTRRWRGLQLPAGDFLAGLDWVPSASTGMCTAAAAGDTELFGHKLKKQLSKRGLLQKQTSRKRFRRGWSLWSVPLFPVAARPVELLKLVRSWATTAEVPEEASLQAALASAVEQIASSGNTPSSGPGFADEQATAWLTALLLIDLCCDAGHELPPAILTEIWQVLTVTGMVLTELPPELPAAGGATDEIEQQNAPRPLELLVAGELRLLLGQLLADLSAADGLADSGRQTILQMLELGTDTDGTPAASLLPQLHAWLASCIRPFARLQDAGLELLDEDSTERLTALLLFAARLLRSDGHLAGGAEISHSEQNPTGDMSGTAGSQEDLPPENESEEGRTAEDGGDPLTDEVLILQAGARALGWKGNSRPGGLIKSVRHLLQDAAQPTKSKSSRSHSSGKGSPRVARQKFLPPFPATQSDWASVACLRSDWTAGADLLGVSWGGEQPQLDLSLAGVPLFRGQWELELSLAGEPVESASRWECSCWFSDRDGDFLELQQKFEHGLRIERQIFLSRTERFLVLADCVSGTDLAHIDYRSRLPGLRELQAVPETETREVRLLDGRKQRARVFPPLLPDDRLYSTAGGLTVEDDNQLSFHLAEQGGMYAPLVIDWEPRRRKSLADWSRLTVTENNRLLRSVDAAGCRLRLGNHQILCYRSLTRGEVARAVLGLHTPCETVIGRFNTEGEVEVLVQVE